ncbi:hypothetical protein RIVM261_074380 [Rivularia sp. IAM M-261]|nr:hypothetical protein RIVM261_074380 [Rivularia sp. IAM M-261]
MKSHVLGFWLAGSNLLSLLSSNPTIAQIAAHETLIRNTVVRQQRDVTVIEGGVDLISIGKNAEQSRNVNSKNQELIIKDLKSKSYNSIIEANVWKVNKSGEVQLIASAPNLINTNSLVSACTSDNAVRSN